MLGDRGVHPVAPAADHHRREQGLPLAQGAVDRGEDGVARAVDDQLVEDPVALGEAGGVLLAAAAAHVLVHLDQGVEEGGAVRERARGGEVLHQHPGLEDVLDLLLGERGHHRALLRVQLDQALHLEAQQGLAHGRTAHADLVGESSFGDHVTGAVDRVEDGPLREVVGALRGGAGGREGRLLMLYPSKGGGGGGGGGGDGSGLFPVVPDRRNAPPRGSLTAD